MSESVKAVGEDEPHGVINGTAGAEHENAEHVLQGAGEDDDSDEYDEEEADYEEEKQIVGDDDDEDDDDEDYEEGDDDDAEGGDEVVKPSMTHLLLGNNPNAPVDGDNFEEDDEDEEDYEPEAPVPTKKRSREELGEDDAQDSKKVKA